MGGRRPRTRLRLVPASRATAAAKKEARADYPEPSVPNRVDARVKALRRVSRRAANLRWSPALFAALIDELIVGDDFVTLLGEPRDLPMRRYAQGVALALAIRHSWQDDDLRRMVRRLQLPRL